MQIPSLLFTISVSFWVILSVEEYSSQEGSTSHSSFGSFHVQDSHFLPVLQFIFFLQLSELLQGCLTYLFFLSFAPFLLLLRTAACIHIACFDSCCGFNLLRYAQANRQIDTFIDKRFSLIAFSFWLFVGDIGSVIGSNLISYVSVEVKRIYH